MMVFGPLLFGPLLYYTILYYTILFGPLLDDGVWATTRGNLSVTLGFVGGLFLAEGISKGVQARFEAEKAWMQIYIRDKIYLADSEQQLNELRNDFERAKTKANKATSPCPVSDYIDGLKPIMLPLETQWRLILEALELIDRRLEQLKGKVEKVHNLNDDMDLHADDEIELQEHSPPRTQTRYTAEDLKRGFTDDGEILCFGSEPFQGWREWDDLNTEEKDRIILAFLKAHEEGQAACQDAGLKRPSFLELIRFASYENPTDPFLKKIDGDLAACAKEVLRKHRFQEGHSMKNDVRKAYERAGLNVGSFG